MKQKLNLLLIASALIIFTGCVSMWRTNKVATDTAYAAMTGWADYYTAEMKTATPERKAELDKQRAEIDALSIKLGTATELFDKLYWEAADNPDSKSKLNNALAAVNKYSAEIIALINQFTSKEAK